MKSLHCRERTQILIVALALMKHCARLVLDHHVGAPRLEAVVGILEYGGPIARAVPLQSLLNRPLLHLGPQLARLATFAIQRNEGCQVYRTVLRW